MASTSKRPTAVESGRPSRIVSRAAEQSDNRSISDRNQTLNLPLIIAKIEKDTSEHIRVTLDCCKGIERIYIRICIKIIAGCAVFVPTKTGIVLDVRLLSALVQALIAAEAKALALGWLEDGGQRGEGGQ